MQNITLTSTLKPVKHRENNILTLLFLLSPFLLECTTREKRNQYTTFFSSHASASYLYTYTKFTYSLSGCHLPTFVLGPFLLGGGDTSTTSGDGGGTSTTSGDELIEMTSSSLQHKIMNTRLLHIIQTSTVQTQKQPAYHNIAHKPANADRIFCSTM